MATISISSDTTIIKNFLKEYKTIFFNGERNLLKDFNEYTHIILNGNILGYHKNPKYLFNILKKLKRKGVINVYTSISWNYQENKIYLNSESGRAIRPTYIVDNKDNKNILRFNNRFPEEEAGKQLSREEAQVLAENALAEYLVMNISAVNLTSAQ